MVKGVLLIIDLLELSCSGGYEVAWDYCLENNICMPGVSNIPNLYWYIPSNRLSSSNDYVSFSMPCYDPDIRQYSYVTASTRREGFRSSVNYLNYPYYNSHSQRATSGIFKY